jgi:hypothetical protein
MTTGFAPKQKGSAEPPALDASILTHFAKLPDPRVERTKDGSVAKNGRLK